MFYRSCKAFDKVPDRKQLERLCNLDIFGKDFRAIMNLYWQQTAWILIENTFSKCTKIESILLANLFNRCNEAILREFEVLIEYIIGGHNLNTIKYAVGTGERKLQELQQKVLREANRND